jgi:glycosyltransferase involved in cell wall biosynthesis
LGSCASGSKRRYQLDNRNSSNRFVGRARKIRSVRVSSRVRFGGTVTGGRVAPSGPISVVVPLPPSYRGGTEEYAYQLARRFSAWAPTRIWTTTVRWTPERGRIDTGAADLQLLPAREWMQRPVLSPFSSLRLLSRGVRSSSLVQLHMPFPWVERSIARRTHRAGTPIVLTYHMDADLGAAEQRAGANWVTRLYRAVSARPALEACSAVVANSRGYAEASPVLSHFLPKVRVIPKGVDPLRLGLNGAGGTRVRPPSVPADSVPDGRKRVLFVGRLVPYKGLPLLLASARRLAEDGVDAVTLVAGRGPMEPVLRAQAKELGLGDRVRFLGFVPDAELGDLYRYADVVVCPSTGTLEATPTTLEEAAACGTPVVGTALPGTSESIPDNGRQGILVPPNDEEALARAVERLLAVDRPSSAPSIRTWDDVAQDYLRLFRELGVSLESSPGGGPGLPARR